jgi:lipopolysaccharide/colanic/teichoic acid biosynthesis glycosyltransferase
VHTDRSHRQHNSLPQLKSITAPDRGFQRAVKRALDVCLSAAALAVLAPALVAIGLTIRLTSFGPALYKWNVVGKDGQPFQSFKFRTMIVNADELKVKLLTLNEMDGPVFKMERDPRVTPVGRWLRKFSLDELPQLYSVLRGDMSLVGPRPPLQSEFEHFQAWHRKKLAVRPGITCLWQVSGRNRVTNFDDWVRMDLEYIDNWSLALDFKILYRTAVAVVRGTGV